MAVDDAWAERARVGVTKVSGRRAGGGDEPLEDEHRRRELGRRSLRASYARFHRAPWRVVAARVVVNALAVALVVSILPGVRESTGHPALGYLALGAILGLINAFLKPAIQFVALPGLLGSMGLVVILVDIITFWILDSVTPLISSSGFGWIVLAGVVLGVLSYLLDNLLGLGPPIVSDRHDIERLG
jgi:putative membrane protein